MFAEVLLVAAVVDGFERLFLRDEFAVDDVADFPAALAVAAVPITLARLAALEWSCLIRRSITR